MEIRYQMLLGEPRGHLSVSRKEKGASRQQESVSRKRERVSWKQKSVSRKGRSVLGFKHCETVFQRTWMV